ncbi:right-handed parallel beta-helix repeat-containing protein [Sinorhizobium meliloti]|nr:right-handed parallel beta-helix repeat-containing protein [Sinorhizobium meliloti]MDW9384194.1 right-handed parallel beta-helix repeat-containing protein [Sinorhizobium meliloti]MDW9503308.1 right-handed parallel beta-helix repeat-containing protein [Sinorhizobium meliloti]
MTITQNGTVIDGMIINGPLRVMADDVVIKNSEITFNSAWGVDAEGAKNFTIQDSDIVGPGSSGDSNSAILGSGTFLRNDISQVENGITLQGGSSTVKGNYIHDLEDSASDPHYDGISVQGGQDGVLIEGNTILARDTSAVFIKNDFGAINDVNVTNNFLGGTPGYDIYVDGRANGGPITNVSITDNHLSMGGYGYYSVDNASPTISGNTELPAGTSPSEVSGGYVGTGLAPDDAASAGSTNSPASGTIEPAVESTSSSMGEEGSTTSGGTGNTELPAGTSPSEISGGYVGTGLAPDDAASAGSTNSPASGTIEPAVESTSSSMGEEGSTTSGGTTVQGVTSADELTGGSTSTEEEDGISSGDPSGVSTGETASSHDWLSGVDHVVFDKLSSYANKHDAVDTGMDAAPTWTSTDKAAGAHSGEEFSMGASADDADGYSSASGSPPHDPTASDEGTAHQFDWFTHNQSFVNWDYAA